MLGTRGERPFVWLAMERKKIVVLGAGFAGIEFCKKIDLSRFEVALVDRQNHHLFQPLLYQVASSGLSIPDIAQPIRMILRKRKGLRVVMEEVTSIDLSARKVKLRRGELDYDYLLIGLGAVTSYFGHPEWEKHAPGLKSVKDAAEIRQRALYAYELAENEPDARRQKELMTTVVIGGGPTGVELAGSFAELARHVLARDFRRIDPREARIVLLEAQGNSRRGQSNVS